MKPLFRGAGIGTLAAIVGVVVTFFIADAISGPLMAGSPGGDVEDVPLAGAVIGTAVGGLVGTLIAFLVRKLDRSVTVFQGICLVGLVLYGVYAFGQADTTATGVWLNVMHIVAAVPIVGSLMNWLQQQASR